MPELDTPRIDLKAYANAAHEIILEEENRLIGTMTRQVLATRERLVRNQLIQMGWIPPAQERGTYDGWPIRVCDDLPDDQAVLIVGRKKALEICNLCTSPQPGDGDA